MTAKQEVRENADLGKILAKDFSVKPLLGD
jgi:hypothetical protein